MRARPRLPFGPMLTGALLALLPAAAFAANGPSTSYVMWWTTVVVLLSLAACSIGFAYRKMRGMDHPTPDEVYEMQHAHDDEHDHDTGHATAH